MEFSCLFPERYNPEHPFDVCVECQIVNAGRCCGPNALAIDPKERCRLLQRRQKFLKNRDDGGWTYDHIAQRSNGISKTTVSRIITDPDYDPGVFAFSEVFKVLFEISGVIFPCGIHSQDKGEIIYVDSPETLSTLEAANQEIERLKTAVEYLKAEGEKKSKIIDKLISL